MPAATAPRWRRVFKGEERQVGVLRRWLASLLPECPARDDVVSVATELGSNALLHTHSGRGGSFAMEITWDRPVVRVAVADRGGPAEPHVIEDPGGEHGRGLLLVRGLSVRTGVNGNEHGRTVWAEIPWDGPELDTPVPAPHSDEAIRAGEAALARRFAGVTAWFGHATREWWALAGSSGLVTAPTAPELAALLLRLLETSTPSRAGTHADSHAPAASRARKVNVHTGCRQGG